MAGGPLDDPRLREVETCLNEGHFDEAQQKLVLLGGVAQLGPGVAYLTTRLLAQRGRLDAAAVTERIHDVLTEAPDFPEARAYLTSLRPVAQPALAFAPTVSGGLDPLSVRGVEPPPASIRTHTPPEVRVTVSSAPFPDPPTLVRAPRRSVPVTLETPRVPGPPPLEPQAAAPSNLGGLEPPRSELPTEPAPPPSEPFVDPLRFEPEPQSAAARGIWGEVELDLASGRVEAALSTLERQAGGRLDQLVERRMPELEAVGQQAADFLGTAPIVCHFPAYDLSLGSLARLDAALALFARRPQRAPRYALAVLLSAYAGECVRRATDGTWRGRLAEPDMATIEIPNQAPYLPWRSIQQALTEGRPLRLSLGPALARVLDPSILSARRPVEPPTAWDPEPWPPFALFQTIGRAVPGSVIGTWAARIAQVPLDRSVPSLAAVDEYLALLATSAVPPSASGGWARRAAVLTGAYVGEVLCLNAGARWTENPDAPPGPLRFELVTPDGGAAYPVLWSLERLREQGRVSIAERARGVLAT